MDNNIGRILEGLDGVQREAVECTEGPVLIVAGAGSGKTRVLTSRIAYVLENGCPPQRILALTFTKKAAAEMKERIGLIEGEMNARKLCMGTFHSVFIRFLREYAGLLGYPASFTIYDTSDSLSALKRCLKEMNLDDKIYKPKVVLSRISRAKNELWTPEAYRKDVERMKADAASKMPRICDVYVSYQNLLKSSGVMDFDDILLNMNILFRDHPDALENIAGRFDYVLVDEYQDTNYSQYLILSKLSRKKRNICVVGDDSQSIYAFRGARIQNILNFSKDFPECKVFKLVNNYRSTQNIVGAANSVIRHNSGRIPKDCRATGDEGEKIHLLKAYTDKEEAVMIASSIIWKIEKEGAMYRDFAILYRTNAQSRALEEALRKRNLPYKIFSGNSFFDRAEVKDMMAYFKLAVNPDDNESFRRAVNTPARGIGDTSVAALASAAAVNKCSLLAAIDAPELGLYGLKPAAVKKLQAFKEIIRHASEASGKKDAYEVAVKLSDECGLYASFKQENSVESLSRAGNIEELLNSVKEFAEKRYNDYVEELMSEGKISDADEIDGADIPVTSLGEYLEDISLLTAVDTADGVEEDSGNKIAMMTVHSAKGLEFPYVYVAGMEDGLFPSESMSSSSADIEEERRLFYVALTRAKAGVTLCYCSSRMRNGQTKEYPVSRFIREIDGRYVSNPLQGGGTDTVELPSRSRVSAPRVDASRPVMPKAPVPSVREDKDFEPVSVLSLRKGMRIEHNKFGFGTILEINGSPADLKAKVHFDHFGDKILLLRYAKIRLA